VPFDALRLKCCDEVPQLCSESAQVSAVALGVVQVLCDGIAVRFVVQLRLSCRPRLDFSDRRCDLLQLVSSFTDTPSEIWRRVYGRAAVFAETPHLDGTCDEQVAEIQVTCE